MKKIRENTPPAGKDLEKAAYSAPTIVPLGPADAVVGRLRRARGSKTDSSGYGTYYLNS